MLVSCNLVLGHFVMPATVVLMVDILPFGKEQPSCYTIFKMVLCGRSEEVFQKKRGNYVLFCEGEKD